ncbi:DUF1254 domain-containing protein [Rhodoferax saidenbachensis]|uniref:DUF1254 domain-containing protein n=1 Tax=Rhodoferax saidenbachensis TaxID=1484693 RepID=A0A1P8KAJ0_9BURK|nr:DUF1254 domain-containing protein [Rhodoferax saidenbachensis]APW43030.1 hypothetical protein RS694_11130 [Rhodoferax saidenbachensis]
MNTLSTQQRLWFYRILTLLVTAILVHLLAVWAAPRLIMRMVLNGAAAQQMDMQNKAAFPPPVTASSRSVVMPSPDLLYSVCVFDVSSGPVRVTAAPKLTSYWSIALYAANSDNFFVINDRQAANKPVDLWLVSEGGNASQHDVPAGSTVVVSPSSKGFLLMRVLTGNYEAEKDLVEPARRTLTCSPT